jgi:60 kDa SS-A/Ro ribonucleoprotein
MRVNTLARAPEIYTHEGAPAYPHLKPIQQLRRSVLACLLWEDTFYEDGHSIADRITETALKVSPQDLAALAIEARHDYKLRHVPLLLLLALTKTGKGIPHLTADTVHKVISRADELAELLALHWKDGRKPIPAQLKKGLARAFSKFDAYQLAKYDRPNTVKLRDVMFMVCPKPANQAVAELFKDLADKKLAPPDTWEVNLSAGKDKAETFTRLLSEGKLGYMALLKNLRLMDQAGVDAELIENAIAARRGAHNILPFRFLSAARAAPRFEPALDRALQASISAYPEFSGQTVVVADCSGSMDSFISGKSQMKRRDVAGVLAGCINGNVRLIGFGDTAKELPHRRGLACADTLLHANVGWSTNAHYGVHLANQWPHDRIIIITDEQVTQKLPKPRAKHAYVINVAAYRNGIGYGDYTHIDGFSEAVIRYMHEAERTL